VQVVIVAEVWKHAYSSEASREAWVGSVVNYPKWDFCNIFCNWESGLHVARGPYVVQAWRKR